MPFYGNGKDMGPTFPMFFSTRRATIAAKKMKNLMNKGMSRKNAANMLRGSVTIGKKTPNEFHYYNPLARSRVGSTASSTASDPHNLFTGINERPRSGIPYSQLNSKARAALKESFKQTFGRRFPSVNTQTRSKSKRVAQAIAQARNHAAAREANRSRRAENKAREASKASNLLNRFSKGLSNRGATATLSKAQEALLRYRSK